MTERFSRRVHLTSRALSGLLVGGVLGVMLALALIARMDAIDSGSSDSPDSTSSDPVQEAIDRHHCSTRGFGPDTIPSSALIRTSAGDLLLVSFDRGWSVYQDPSDQAKLVAVCLDDPPPDTTQKRP